jgi:hypothetical protein
LVEGEGETFSPNLSVMEVMVALIIMNCQIAASHLGLDKQFGIGGCKLRKDGEWRQVKDILPAMPLPER